MVTGTVLSASREAFYATAAQVIPVFLLALAIELRVEPLTWATRVFRAFLRVVPLLARHHWAARPVTMLLQIVGVVTARAPQIVVCGLFYAEWIALFNLMTGRESSWHRWYVLGASAAGLGMTVLVAIMKLNSGGDIEQFKSGLRSEAGLGAKGDESDAQ